MESLQEILDYLKSTTRLDLKAIALQHVLGGYSNISIIYASILYFCYFIKRSTSDHLEYLAYLYHYLSQYRKKYN